MQPVAEVQLSRTDAENGGLPSLCMQCGAPAATEVVKKYSTDSVDLLPPVGLEGPAGCLLFPLWMVMAFLKFLSWSTAKTMSVRTPLCDKHARGWFTWSNLDAKSITEETIVLTGVSEEFAQAWRKRAVSEQLRSGGFIKVRCVGCQTLNEESARFCNQCGAALRN